MTTLPDKITQLSYGWNTLERLIIGSAFNLFRIMKLKSLDTTYKYNERISITSTTSNVSPKIIISINFDLDNLSFFNSGEIKVKVFQNDVHLSTDLNEFDGDYISDPLFDITNLENYWVWACYQLNRNENVTIAPNYDSGTVMFTVTLPLDYNVLRETQNNCLISSIRINTDLKDLMIV